MDPLDFLGAVLRHPRLDPHAPAAQFTSASSSATHQGGSGAAGTGAAAFPTSTPFVATGGGPGKSREEEQGRW